MIAKPFVKWTGGKTRTLNHLRSLVPSRFGVYHEPFIGGGAMFFDLFPTISVISDTNCHLIQAYKAVRDNPYGVMSELNGLTVGEEEYYAMRDRDTALLSYLQAAARVIYLTKTGFNGLWRENKSGRNNVPWGKRKPGTALYTASNIMACHHVLRGSAIYCRDFSCVLLCAAYGDLVYFDPPYVPISATSNFTAYTKAPFGKAQHELLRDVCGALTKRGVYVMLSNSSSPIVEDLYSGFKFHPVDVRRNNAADASARGVVKEYIITNYTQKEGVIDVE